MKASELISNLLYEIETYGNYEVMFYIPACEDHSIIELRTTGDCFTSLKEEIVIELYFENKEDAFLKRLRTKVNLMLDKFKKTEKD